MKITIDIGLDDLLEEVEDWDDWGQLSTHYELKDQSTLEKDIKEKLVDDIYRSIKYHTDWFKDIVNEVLTNSKQEIVDGVIKAVSNKIINQKALKEFKKGLDE